MFTVFGYKHIVRYIFSGAKNKHCLILTNRYCVNFIINTITTYYVIEKSDFHEGIKNKT